jgi:hypothetical protein
MNCSECGFTMWSAEAKQRGAHPECLDDIHDTICGMDAEDAIEEILDDEQPSCNACHGTGEGQAPDSVCPQCSNPKRKYRGEP